LAIPRRLVEYGAAILVGVAVWALVFLYVEIGPFTWMPSARWWELAAVTALLLWATAREFQRHWHRWSFWLHLSWLTALHVAGWTVVLMRVDKWGAIWFVPPIVVEAPLLILCLHRLGFSPGRRRRARSAA